MIGPPTELASVLGLGASSIVNAVLNGLTSWVESGAADVIRDVGTAIKATSSVPLNSAFLAPYAIVRGAGAELCGLFLCLAIVHAVVRQDLAGLGRTLLLRLPLALLGSGVAIELVALALSATDELSSDVFSAAGTSATGFAPSFAALLTGPSVSNLGFLGFALALVAAVVAFVLWVELVIRSSAVVVAALFIPIALAACVWSATTTWLRRLAEILVALILSKFVVAGVLALSLSELGSLSGVDGIVQGVSLLLLATASPFTLLRLVPAIEAGSITHLEGLARRGAKGAMTLAEFGAGAVGGGADFVASPEPTIPFVQGLDTGTAEFASIRRQVGRDLLGEDAENGEDKDR